MNYSIRLTMLAAMLSQAVVSAEAQILADDEIHTVGPPTGICPPDYVVITSSPNTLPYYGCYILNPAVATSCCPPRCREEGYSLVQSPPYTLPGKGCYNVIAWVAWSCCPCPAEFSLKYSAPYTLPRKGCYNIDPTVATSCCPS